MRIILTKPQIIWGLFDCFPADTASYYLILKRATSTKIKLILTPSIGLPKDFIITVSSFTQLRGCENMQIIKNDFS